MYQQNYIQYLTSLGNDYGASDEEKMKEEEEEEEDSLHAAVHASVFLPPTGSPAHPYQVWLLFCQPSFVIPEYLSLKC